eukprot:114986_1
MSARQMLKSMMVSANMKHLARSLLFLHPKAGLRRNKFWKETMDSDVLVFDFQDGCPPEDRHHVMEGLSRAHEIYPNMKLSVRLTELERNITNYAGSTILDELTISMKQRQVYWLMLPMCDDSKDIQEYIDMVNHIDPNWLKYHGALKIICETPLGRRNLDDMLGNHPGIKGVIVGGGDYFRFAQCKDNLFLPQLRYDILNACLCHGRFPIDTPPLALGIEDEIAVHHFRSAHDAGFRSGIVLHPMQTKVANDIFSPCPRKVQEYQTAIGPWLEKRQTGYKHNSGDDFVGPPHMKQFHWTLQYHDAIRSKKTTHTQFVDQSIIPQVHSLLSQAASHKAEEFTNILLFLALSTTCHARHEDLLANLGFSNIQLSQNANIQDATYVSSQIIGRRLTSAGKVIVTTKVQILNRDHETICELERRLFERKLSFDEYANEGIYSHMLSNEYSYTHMTNDMIQNIIDNAELISNIDSTSISVDTHADYCSLLNLDAPLHHTKDELPTIPSTLHIAHHNINNTENEKYIFQNITFHAPLKPNTQYRVKQYRIDKDISEKFGLDGPGYLSILEDGNGKICSSILIKGFADEAIVEQILNEEGVIVDSISNENNAGASAMIIGDLNDKTEKELKEMCIQNGLFYRGSKEDCIERLKDPNDPNHQTAAKKRKRNRNNRNQRPQMGDGSRLM